MAPKNFKNDVDSAILTVWHISSLEDILEIYDLKQELRNQTRKFRSAKLGLTKSNPEAKRSFSNEINQKYLSLLSAAGISTVEDLSEISPENLLSNLLDINLEKKIIPQVPSLSQIYDWIRQAVVFKEVLSY